MKKIAFIFTLTLALIFSSFNVFSQNTKEVTLEGKSVESWDKIGTEWRYFDTKKANVIYYFNMDIGAFILMNDNDQVLGTYLVSFYKKNDKQIDQKDVIKMLNKNKVSYYIFESVETTNGNSYMIYLPVDLSYVKYIEIEDNHSYMFKFKVSNAYNGIPELNIDTKNLR